MGDTTADATLLTTLLIVLATIGACYSCCGFDAAVMEAIDSLEWRSCDGNSCSYLQHGAACGGGPCLTGGFRA
ncbi:hypothetical protein [Anaerobiospirillum succiniciproducens]|uniref:hypothetical protein n=1 Tax=Anaerobiospirillum succiniciproducens TaxID=13335 RepID=UPI0004248943|nr:hypothetical protein [Anaerobiospirillum succiniciproducens]